MHVCSGAMSWKDVRDVRSAMQSIGDTAEAEQLAAALTWKIPEYQASLLKEAQKIAAMAWQAPEYKAKFSQVFLSRVLVVPTSPSRGVILREEGHFRRD